MLLQALNLQGMLERQLMPPCVVLQMPAPSDSIYVLHCRDVHRALCNWGRGRDLDDGRAGETLKDVSKQFKPAEQCRAQCSQELSESGNVVLRFLAAGTDSNARLS